jgi:hypothetical protein
VTIPVAEKAKPRRIEVAVNGGATSLESGGDSSQNNKSNNSNKDVVDTTAT